MQMDCRQRKSNLVSCLAGLFIGLYLLVKVYSMVLENSIKSELSLLREKRESRPRNYCPGPNGPINFTDFDNSIGMENGCYIVPNHIHYIRWSNKSITYLEMIYIMSSFKNQNPEKMIFHYNNMTTFSGKYWEILLNTPGFKDILELEYWDMPKEIFGQPIHELWWPFHGGDISRLRILEKYGGIYLDNDVYVIKSLNDFRHYEMTLGAENMNDRGLPSIIGTQILLAHKDARFLKLWIESFRNDYHRDAWYYNGGILPAKMINEHPNVLHAESDTFGNNMYWRRDIYGNNWDLWKKSFYTLHSSIRSLELELTEENLKKYPFINELNETNILNCNLSIREMALAVYNPTNYTIK